MAKTTRKSLAASTTKRAVPNKTTTKTTTRATTTEKSSSSRAARRDDTLLGLPLTTWVSDVRKVSGADLRSGKRAFVFAFGRRDSKSLKAALGDHLSRWQMQMLQENEGDSVFFQGANGPVWILRAAVPTSRAVELEKSPFARFRDLVGPVVLQMAPYQSEKLILELRDLGTEETKGLLAGLEMATYFYAENRPDSPRARRQMPRLLVREAIDEAVIREASELALATHIARHLVNLPGGELNPRSYAEAIENLFAGSDTMEVEIWEGEKLKAERMNLLLAVGGGAADGPRLVHLRYRPQGANASAKPVAFVGKGITFDSGGLDIKPSSAMRWMKKDMGGSASVVALAKWVERTALPMPVDFYLAIAENAISGSSFRPGDIITARSGMTVEIHNTDAEGRLVLADALDVAVTQDEMPSAIINVATLTGAIKVGLGAEIAGLFSNDDQLANSLFDCGLVRGDLNWRMPLFQPYRGSLRSTFADVANASDGFGGAITAALFLESFVKGVPWAHLDVYAWKDGAGGAWSESGGNGQPVQALTEFMNRLVSNQPGSEGATA